MNKVIQVGRLTADPQINYANSGTSIATFVVAVDRRVKQEGQPTADFIRCKAFGKTAEFVEKYFRKGSKIILDGRIQTGSYEKDGQRIYTTDVIAEQVEFGESKGSESHAKNDDFMKIDGDEEMPFK